MTNTELKKALELLAEANRLTKRCAGLLNCKESDIKITLAAEFEARGMNAETITDKHGNSTLFTYKKGTVDSLVADTDKMKDILTAQGIDIPFKTRKGASATLIVK